MLLFVKIVGYNYTYLRSYSLLNIVNELLMRYENSEVLFILDTRNIVLCIVCIIFIEGI